MTTIAFIGLGIMGQPMSIHLQNAGFDVCGVNLEPDRLSRWSTPADAAPARSPRR